MLSCDQTHAGVACCHVIKHMLHLDCINTQNTPLLLQKVVLLTGRRLVFTALDRVSSQVVWEGCYTE